VIVNSEGAREVDQTWGKQASSGQEIGVALFEHPSSFHHPSKWHVRDYGLLAINPFGSNAFDKQAPVSKVALAPGKSIRLRYRIVIHPEMGAAEIGRLYRGFAEEK